MMNEIIEQAGRLGGMIAKSMQATKLREAKEALHKDAAATALLADYQKQAMKVGQLEEQNKPIEVEDKRKLQELQSKLVSMDVFKKFTATQVEYIDLMRKVNEALRKELAGTEE
jgi:cell fate (sporulation/competence/biofilm development) regulator YlbF (YheA/YmcA/DUF963 family)